MQLEEGETAREDKRLGHLLTCATLAAAHLLLLQLLPDPGAAGFTCPGRIVQGRDKVRPQGHPLTIQVVGHPGYTFQGQVVLPGQCELGPHVDSTGLAVE